METQDTQQLFDGINQAFSAPLSTVILRVVLAIAVIFIGRFIVKLLTRTARASLKRANIDDTLVVFLGKIFYYTLIIVLVVIALGVLGVPTTSLIAILGAATLAIGLALQDSISNLASGVLIIGLRPFSVGDYIETADEFGFVTDIRLFHTLLTTRDNKAVFIPNKEVLGDAITNYSDTDMIRLELVYGIGYGDDILKAKQILREIVEGDERVAKDPPPVIAVKELGDSSVNLTARPFVDVEDEPAVTFDITEQVKLRFDEAGISIPFPQRDVHLFQPN